VSKITVTVSGPVGSGKSAICGEIEILCKALGLEVNWFDGDQEKNLSGADYIHDLEMYKPTVEIVEVVDRARTTMEDGK
jgi:adenylylsulfate kinase-like enzyme